MKYRILFQGIFLPLVLILIFTSLTADAQKAYEFHTKNKKAVTHFLKASRMYDAKQLLNARDELEAALKEDPEFLEAAMLMGDVTTDLNDFQKAVTYYRKAVLSDPDFFPQNFFNLAQAEIQLSEFDSAVSHLEIFLTYKSRTLEMRERAEKLLAQSKFAAYAVKHPVPFNPINPGKAINSSDDEYLPVLTADEQTIVYTRRRLMSSPGERKTYNEDFYLTTKDPDGNWHEARNLGSPINTIGNEGAHCLSPDGRHLFFTACNKDGFRGCDLYYAKRNGNQWTNPVNLGSKVNSDQWDSQPTITSDGKTIYFVSSRPGGKGKQDIWKTTVDENGRFQTPVNLGDVINTSGNEMSPFIHPDNRTLYFASDGHPGMGGTDIYVSRLLETGEWSKPFNLGYPINTVHDESSLFVTASGKSAYFATDRFRDGFGKLDIWYFDLYKEVQPTPVSYVKGNVRDKQTGSPLEASFEVIDLNSAKVATASISDKTDGSFLVCLPTGYEYALNVSKEGYLFYSDFFSCKDTSANSYSLQVELSAIKAGEKIILKNVFYETGKYDLKDESFAELNKAVAFLKKNKNISIEISGHTDNTGESKSNLLLSEKRAASVYNYLIKEGIESSRLTSKGYGEDKPVASNNTELGRAKNRRTEMMITLVK
ncbi:MAG: OmpA family protein [Bacteroidia bacterium]|nr:PD40 domain-containing protein [Bacteroidia bacterium]MCZ2277684.1 OmpA family protein [Bacteroidia bacterium]